jgi:hypothetical protein
VQRKCCKFVVEAKICIDDRYFPEFPRQAVRAAQLPTWKEVAAPARFRFPLETRMLGGILISRRQQQRYGRQKEVSQLCSHSVIGWLDAPPGIFGVRLEGGQVCDDWIASPMPGSVRISINALGRLTVLMIGRPRMYSSISILESKRPIPVRVGPAAFTEL